MQSTGITEMGRQVTVVLYVVALASRHSRCRCRVLEKPILGTADSEYWHCLGVRSFLLEIPQASMNKSP